jgi:acetyl-CoA synthetase
MSQERVYQVPQEWAETALIGAADYEEKYRRSIEDPDGFWREGARRLDWLRSFTQVKDTSFAQDDLHIRWFADGTLNLSANCLDRHLAEHGDTVAIIFEPDDPAGEVRRITYRELYEETCRFANAMKARGVKKGDRVTIYLPMIPEAAVAMLACCRIGAVHSVVFGGFSPEALGSRIEDCASTFVITADCGLRGGRRTELKAQVDEALERHASNVATVVVINAAGSDVPMREGRDVWYHEAIAAQPAECPPEEMGAEDPLFILYTSGSTGKPKGVLHTTGGYGVWVSMTHEYVFDYRPGDIYWCAADIGWVTGHSYIVYGPLMNRATSVMFGGVPNWPDFSRFWQVVDKHQVNQFYAAPTALRALMREGDEWVSRTDRSSLRVLGTVGEPINPEAWEWYYQVVGNGRCPIVDTWWQTETGGHMITPMPGAGRTREGHADRGRRPGRARHHRQLARPDAHRLRRPRALLPDLFQPVSRHVFHRRWLPP